MRRFCEFVLDCQQAFHRECVSNSEKCTKDRKFTTTLNFNPSKPKKTQKNPSSTNQIICFSLFFDFLLIFIKTTTTGSFSADSLIHPLFSMSFACMQQHALLSQRVFFRRSIGFISAFNGIFVLLVVSLFVVVERVEKMEREMKMFVFRSVEINKFE